MTTEGLEQPSLPLSDPLGRKGDDMPATQPTSLIDVLDSSGRPVGVAPRSDAFEQGLRVRTVHVFVFDSDGRLLLQQLGRGRDRHPLLWGSSVAGFPRPGEEETEAASRRMSEELGLSAPVKLVGTTMMRDGDSEKFVTLFEARADHVGIAEPDHIERIEFREVGEVGRELVEQQANFTETFRHVFAFWLRQRSGPAGS
jgi:isopentenyl-diphosphate delta-isomerase